MIDRQQKILIIHFLMLFTFIFNLYATVIISEIMPNPASIGEWIEIYNSSSEDLSIANWQIIDRAGNSGKRRQPSIYIRSHTYIILAPDSSTIAKLNLIPTIVAIVMENWAGMNNDGDGFDDIAIISFLLPTSKSRVSAYIYDLEANLIQQIAADLPTGPTLPNLQWAGKSSTERRYQQADTSF